MVNGESEDDDYGPMITRCRLGRIMHQLRERSRMSLDEAAKAIEYTQASLSRVENGQQGLNVHVAKSMLDVYGESDRYEEILELCRRSQRKGWWQAYGIGGRGYITLESDAESARTFEVLLVPGLLQAPGYTRALFKTTSQLPAERTEKLVTIRMIRQERLRKERRPLTLEAIVHEAALRCPTGGVDVMYEQLAHMAELAKLPTVSLRILPNSAGNHPSMPGGFVILTFPEKALPDMLYIEHAFGGIDTVKKQEVDRAKLKFDRLRAAALDEAESLGMLQRIADELA